MDSLKPNDLFRTYLLIRKIAVQDKQGVRGVLWLATATRGLPYTVVLKIQRAKAAKDISALTARVHNESLILRKHGGHPNVVEFVETFETDTGDLVMVFKYCQGGSLVTHVEREIRKWLHTPKYITGADLYPSGIHTDFVQKVFVQMVEGVSYMHQRGVAHMDIKLENTCLDESGNAVLIDWEFALLLMSEGREAYIYNVPCGTPGYAPPEIILRWPYDPRGVDVWCLGVCLFILVFGEAPFPSKAVPEDAFQSPLVFRDHVDDDLTGLLLGMLNIDPKDRLTIVQVKQHAAFACMAPHIRRTSTEGCESGNCTPRSDKSSSSDIVDHSNSTVLTIPEGFDTLDADPQPTSPRSITTLFSILNRARKRLTKAGGPPALTVTAAEYSAKNF
jgi:serine/threonine protein kinase